MGEAEDLAGRAWARLGGRAEDQAVIFLYVAPPWWNETTGIASANSLSF